MGDSDLNLGVDRRRTSCTHKIHEASHHGVLSVTAVVAPPTAQSRRRDGQFARVDGPEWVERGVDRGKEGKKARGSSGGLPRVTLGGVQRPLKSFDVAPWITCVSRGKV